MLNHPKMEGICVGDAGFWTLQWPVQRTDPIPGPIFYDTSNYPELLDEAYEEKMNNHLDQYYLGPYKKLVEELGQDARTWGRLMSCGNECGIGPHRDHDVPGHMIRLHVNIQTNEKSTWHFGTDLADTPKNSWKYMNRKYIPKSGEIYLVNVGNVHSPVNYGNTDWILLHSDPSDESIDRLLKSNFHITFDD